MFLYELILLFKYSIRTFTIHMSHFSDTLLFALFILLITAVVASVKYRRPHEAFVNEALVISDRIYFVKAGLVNFFAQAKNAIGQLDPEFKAFVQNTVSFFPNYLDICCKTTKTSEGTAACEQDCNQISLLTSACIDDKAIFMNEYNNVSTISGKFGIASKENCKVAILGNQYQLVKRTMNMTNMWAGVQQVGNTSQNLYRLELQGNHIFFVLSRPMFITFANAGLYRVLYEDVNKATAISTSEPPRRRHAFAYFTTMETPNYVYVQKVENEDIENFEMYAPSSANLVVENKANPVTLFYMNYLTEVTQSSMTAYSTTIILDNVMFDRLFKNTSNIMLSTNQDNKQKVTSFGFVQNQDLSLAVQVDEDVYPVPDDIRYYENSDLSNFHIVVTISYDVLTMVLFTRHAATKSNTCTMVRHHLTKVFQCNKDLLKQSLTQRGLMPLEHLSDVFNFTAIPNYAHLAVKLGYSFDSV